MAARQAVDDPVFSIFQQLDGYSGMRQALRAIAQIEECWAGIPMPLESQRLVIEPNFPRAAQLSNLFDKPKDQDDQGIKYRGSFWSMHMKCNVLIFEDVDGKIRHVKHRPNPLDRLISIMDCSHAWGIEQESKAVHTLGSLIRHHQFKMYVLTGMFMERSERTNLLYIFRRLRPTVVLGERDNQLRIRCALCMHPIGYYDDTWAGAMTPTDDVIAHLMLMRGDEPMLWRRSNQHPPWSPNAGIAA